MFRNGMPAILLAAALVTTPWAASGQGKGGNSGASSTTTIPVSTGKGPINAEVLVDRFKTLAGSEDNAKSLVEGLRNGTPVSLAGREIPGTCTREVVTCVKLPTGHCLPGTKQIKIEQYSCPVTIPGADFAPPTGNMGWGNVEIALAFGAAQVTELELQQPTPAQLKAVFVGGEVEYGASTPKMKRMLPGVLQLRSQGMGWPQVASQLGYQLQ